MPQEPRSEPTPESADELRLVVRVWIPDRPGALGLVASRIGALGADIVGIDVLERNPTVAVDEFAIVLARRDLEALLVREIEQVDGASVEECREVVDFPDARTDALVSAERLCSAPDRAALLQVLADDLREEFAATWTAVLTGGTVVAESGTGVPDAGRLAKLAELCAPGRPGPAALDGGLAPIGPAGSDPDDHDVAVAEIPRLDALLLTGRDGHPFRVRERRQLLALARITDLLADRLRDRA